MFEFIRRRIISRKTTEESARDRLARAAQATAASFLPEGLEGRVLLSGVPWCTSRTEGAEAPAGSTVSTVAVAASTGTISTSASSDDDDDASDDTGGSEGSSDAAKRGRPGRGPGFGFDRRGEVETVDFGELPKAVQDGLSALAQGATIADNQQVQKVTRTDRGDDFDDDADDTTVTTYAAVISVNGQPSHVAVDAEGDPIAGRVAFGDAPDAVQTGLQTLADGTTIPDDQLVDVRAGREGSTIYSTSVTVDGAIERVAVDETGAAFTRGPRGGAQSTEEFGTLPDAVRDALSSLAQGTAIADDQDVFVHEKDDDTTVYSLVLNIDGRPTRIAVDGDGTLLEGTVTLGDAPQAVQDGLQDLVTDETVPSPIPATQLVRVSSRPDGKTVYSTTVTVDGVTTRLAVDEAGAAVETRGRSVFAGGGGFAGGPGGRGPGGVGPGGHGPGGGGGPLLGGSGFAPRGIR